MCSFPTMKFKAAEGGAELVGFGVAAAVVFVAEFGVAFAVSLAPLSRGGPFSF